jgi:hypothetical protein
MLVCTKIYENHTISYARGSIKSKEMQNKEAKLDKNDAQKLKQAKTKQ